MRNDRLLHITPTPPYEGGGGRHLIEQDDGALSMIVTKMEWEIS